MRSISRVLSLPSFARLGGFSLALVTAGCASAPGGMTTASIRPRPDEGMMQRPAYSPSSTLGARPIATASLPVRTRQPAFKTYQYPWNGNRERIQTGSVAPILNPAQQPITWKTSPVVAPSRLASNAPAFASSAPVKSYASGREIIVAPGDTLFSLSTKHNVSMTSLMQVNRLPSPAIKVSQRLFLPAAR